MPNTDAPQLSFDVALHPELAKRKLDGDHIWLQGTLAIKVEIPVDRDYNAGDRFVVTIAGPDGEVIGHAHAELTHPSFKDIIDKDLGRIGTTRIHKADQTN